jgi:hypothetical protein
MITQLLLGCAEKHSAQTAHGGGHISKDWGGIPIVVLFGDDYQLPPLFGAGATKRFFCKGKSHFSTNGAAGTTMELKQIM